MCSLPIIITHQSAGPTQQGCPSQGHGYSYQAVLHAPDERSKMRERASIDLDLR